jgi:hypothetical protein
MTIMLLEGLHQFEKSNDLVGNQNHNLPDYSIIPQPATLPYAPKVKKKVLLN